MATKPKTSMALYVAIGTYKLQDCTFDHLCVSVSYRKGKGFYVGYHPGWYRGGVWGCIFDFSKNPLTASTSVPVMAANKNSTKVLEGIYNNLSAGVATKIIAFLFDKRAFETLDMAIRHIATDPTWATEGLLNELTNSLNKGDNSNENNSTNNSSTISNNKTMTQNVKAADLIGKTLIGTNNGFKYQITSVQDDKLYVTFTRGDVSMPNVPFSIDNLLGMVEKGTAKWADENTETTANEPIEEGATAEEIEDEPTATDENEVEEVDATEAVEEQPEPVKAKIVEMPKVEKPKATAKTSTPKAKTTTAKTSAKVSGKYEVDEYETSKKKDAKWIIVADKTDANYLMACNDLHCVRRTGPNKKGKRRTGIAFGPRYAAIVESVCDALNEGKTLMECKPIIDGNTEALHKANEERKAKWEARKAEREAAKNEPKATEGKGKATKADAPSKESVVNDVLAQLAKNSGIPVEQLQALLEKKAA